MKIKVFRDPIFKRKITFMWDINGSEVIEYWKKRNFRLNQEIKSDFGGHVSLTHRDKEDIIKNHQTCLWIGKKDIGLLVHETYHLIYTMLDDKDIPIKGNDELVGYYLEHYINLFWKAMK